MQQLLLYYLIVSTVTLLIVSVSKANGGHTSCETSNAVEGQAASILCRFPDSPSRAGHTLKILKHSFESLWEKVPDMISSCQWRSNNENPECRTSTGYDMKVHENNTVTASIKRVTIQHAGVYVCTYSYSRVEHDDAVCKLLVRE